MAQDWDIKPRGSACAVCDKEFADGQAYLSALIHDEGGYRRADCCADCWKNQELSAQTYSTWRGVYRKPAPETPEVLGKETAESLLRKLCAGDDRSKAAVMYILAVMLERKRVLIERDARTDEQGRILVIYEHRRTGETFLIPDPRLGMDQVESVQAEVLALLAGKPDEPAAPATPPETPPV